MLNIDAKLLCKFFISHLATLQKNQVHFYFSFSSEESKPPSAVIAADVGEMQPRADAVSTNLSLPIQCQTSSSDNLHSNKAIVKIEDTPEVLETVSIFSLLTPVMDSCSLLPTSVFLMCLMSLLHARGL